MTTEKTQSIRSIEQLNHYIMPCCDFGFTVGSDMHGKSKEPNFCPFCGAEIESIGADLSSANI